MRYGLMDSLSRATLPKVIVALLQAITDGGGRGWLVGGWVRDRIMGKRVDAQTDDYDIEVYGLEWQPLQRLLAPFGRVTEVGRQFSVLKLCCHGLEIDVALPRRERRCGVGHRAFSVVADPLMPVEQASRRRDFTINAMMYDPLQQRLLDLHGGQEDLRLRVLRHVGAAFEEDPLRPLRAMQFCARFDLQLAEDTAALCRTMVSAASSLPTERVWQEWRKWALADHPAAGLRALSESGWLRCYAPLSILEATPQDPHWHPEGDVWQHTLLVCDQVVRVAKREKLAERQRLVLMFSALCHDVGKPMTTTMDDSGVVRSRGHAKAGLEPTDRLLHFIGAPSWLRERALPLVREHLVHLHGKATPRAVRRLAHRLQPNSIAMWEHLIEADASGRYPNPVDRPALSWLRLALKLKSSQQPPAPLVTGRWLLTQGMKPGPAVGQMLEHAWQAQLDGEITSMDDVDLWWQQQASRLTPRDSC